MNFVKRNFPIVMNLISVIFIIISIESVTSNGIPRAEIPFIKQYPLVQNHLILIMEIR